MTGSGTLLDPYVIWDVNDLQDMNLDLTAYYELGQDIDAIGINFEPIGEWIDYAPGSPPAGYPGVNFNGHRYGLSPFIGQLDGKGYSVSNLSIDWSTSPQQFWVGLFGWTQAAEVKNLTLASIAVSGNRYIGGLAGMTKTSTLTDCTISGDINYHVGGLAGLYVGGLVGYMNGGSVTSSHVSGTVTGREEVGGLIGRTDDATIESSHSTSAVSLSEDCGGGLIGRIYIDSAATLSKCFATGNVAGDDSDYLGGLVGRYDGAISSDCYAMGDVADGGTGLPPHTIGGFIGYLESGAIEDCYSTGAPTTGSTDPSIGGLVGWNDGAVVNCFWDIETSGQATSDGGTGKTTAEMKTQSIFTDAGWDFTTIWIFNEVDTEAADNIELSHATLNGVLTLTIANDGYPYLSITPLISSDCNFEWGETLVYGNTTALQSKDTGEVFSQLITGLTAATTYHFRAAAVGSHTIYGDDKTFVTESPLAERSPMQPEFMLLLQR